MGHHAGISSANTRSVPTASATAKISCAYARPVQVNMVASNPGVLYRELRPPLDSGCDRHHKICDWYRVRAMPPGRVHRDQSYSAARRCVRLKSTRCPLLAQSRHDRCPPAMRRPSGFIAPCLPSKVSQPPSGPLWVHEIKRDRYGTRAPHLKESLSCH